MSQINYRGYRYPPDVIQRAVWLALSDKPKKSQNAPTPAFLRLRKVDATPGAQRRGGA